MMENGWLRAAAALALTLCCFPPARAEEPANPVAPGERSRTTITRDAFDHANFTVWVDGEEETPAGLARSPEWLVLTRDGRDMGWSGIDYGGKKVLGPRHLRIAFHEPVEAGTLLTIGDGVVSVLKPGAEYPGRLEDDDDWIVAEYTTPNGDVTSAQPGSNISINAWVLPEVVKTRALRFSHVPDETAPTFAGRLGGVLVLPARYDNAAPRGRLHANAGNHLVARLVDGRRTTWNAWENRALPHGQDNRQTAIDNPEIPVVSAANPVRIVLSWTAPVTLAGLGCEFGSFSVATVETYTGPDDLHPADADAPENWRKLADANDLSGFYPWSLTTQILYFPETVATRALRLNITRSDRWANHEHVQHNALGGKRVALDEIIALAPLGDQALADAVVKIEEDHALAARETPPPIPVRFSLPEDGFVTLVIENADGQRVRNLISERPFPAGEHTVGWDASDDLTRDDDAASHGLYRIPTRVVAPGEYTVRGLWRKEVRPLFERTLYRHGTPPWETADGTGAWMADHTPPQSALFLPGARHHDGRDTVWLGSYVVESGSGLIRVALDGTKISGKRWIGGHWTAAPFLARDEGANAIEDHAFYVGSAWELGKNPLRLEIRVTPIGVDEREKNTITHAFTPARQATSDKGEDNAGAYFGGFAVRDGFMAVTMPASDNLLVFDIREGTVIGEYPVEHPGAAALDTDGRLYLVSDAKILRTAGPWDPRQAPAFHEVNGDWDQPVFLLFNEDNRLYVSQRGQRHNVGFYEIGEDGTATAIARFGERGTPDIGPYNPNRMNDPAGLALDADGFLWVTECNYLPKRISVWAPDGSLREAMYGPSKYGGGGTVDPTDQTRAFYAEAAGTMEFHLNPETDRFEPLNILYRPLPGGLGTVSGFGTGEAPEMPIYHENGRRYFTNSYNNNPTNGSPFVVIYHDFDGELRPVAAAGNPEDWSPDGTQRIQERLVAMAGLTLERYYNIQYWDRPRFFCLWTDEDGDGQAQDGEIQIIPVAGGGGVTVMEDLSVCVTRLNGRATRFAPVGFTADGAPRYDIDQPQVIMTGVMSPGSTGGDQMLVNPKTGWAVVTLGFDPFPQTSVSGSRFDGSRAWSYPTPWPGLHASHSAPTPSEPGQLIGTTRLLGGLFEVAGSDAGRMWALNSNHGQVYIFTEEGLFVATLFQDFRLGRRWNMPVARPGMLLDGLTLGDENFWPSITGTPDGRVFVIDGGRNAVVRLEGLETVQRLPDTGLMVTPEDLARVEEWRAEREAQRRTLQGTGVLKAPILARAPEGESIESAWRDAQWVDIDKSGAGAYWEATTKAYNITGSLAVSGNRLYAVWRTSDPRIADNRADIANALFKTGGALDLMLGTNPQADPNRRDPVAGDLRLLMAFTGDPNRPVFKANLYRAIVPGTAPDDRIPFSSPWRTVHIDRVDDVSAEVEWQRDPAGNFMISVPLSVLGLSPRPGMEIKGDIGVLRGADGATNARVYWSNKATAIVSDVPSEAALTPYLWGTVKFE